MTRLVLTLIATAITGTLNAATGYTCTTVCLLEHDRAVVAYNYDFYPSEGLVLVNKRGTSKRSWVEPRGASWTARHGNVTFNQFGRDNPTTGVNEKGLMVSLMWLNGTEYPPADDRPAVGILEWIQYHLDRHANVAEVIANAETMRPTSSTPIHYLFADASGDAAVIEFLDGTLTIYRGDGMPIKALANSTYAQSLAAFETYRKTGATPVETAKTTGSYPGFGSLDRFVRGATLSAGEGDPVARGFDILEAVKQGMTRWSIVYDLTAGDVHFKTGTNEQPRRFTLTNFDFSCRTPVRMLDVTAPGSGVVHTAFVDYTRAANRALLEVSLGGRSKATKDMHAAHPDLTSACRDTD
ncbi:MAG: linear amide C-N hydrolase [Alphaproteobacteria bacterium]|jgi:choloylglycine hydrolase|nr:linear amide C-N hydrolase [Alphaproteobacteria bacterium]MDP6815517.1 linear amide C-N hydrolase [Alphaproteobacteria bacterium]